MNLSQTLLLAQFGFNRASRSDAEWVERFRAVGYFAYSSDSNWVAPTLPDAVTLYRGASPGSERGLWWTPEPRYAQMFGQVYTATLPRDAVLMVRWDPFMREVEYLIDLPSEVHPARFPELGRRPPIDSQGGGEPLVLR